MLNKEITQIVENILGIP